MNYVYIVVEDTTDYDTSEEVVREFAMTIQGAKRIAKKRFGILIKEWKRDGRCWVAKYKMWPNSSIEDTVWIEKVKVSE